MREYCWKNKHTKGAIMSTQFKIKKYGTQYKLLQQLPRELMGNKVVLQDIKPNFNSPLEAAIYASAIAAEKYKDGDIVAEFSI